MAQESIWLRQLTSELGSYPKKPTNIFEDNQSAIAMTKILSFINVQNILTLSTTLFESK